MPITDRTVERLEREDVQLAFQHVEDLLAHRVDMGADVKALVR